MRRRCSGRPYLREGSAVCVQTVQQGDTAKSPGRLPHGQAEHR